MPRKKLIEVALPLEAINEASAREKSIRHGHPSTLHLWWARRPLAACRAVIFASLVDDPGDDPGDDPEAEAPKAPPAFVEACRTLPYGPIDPTKDTPRQRLFKFIEILVEWESTTDEAVLGEARRLIKLATDGNPPPLLDPFAGGGSIPLEAQRLGLRATASDLNPVAVMINKALIEIPPKFAAQPPVNPRDQANLAGAEGWQGAAGLAADVRYYGQWMRDQAQARIGHLYPPYKTKEGEETVIAWLWARTVRCPNPACGAMMPLVLTFELSKKKGRKAWVVPQVDPQSRKITFRVETGEGYSPKGTVNRRGATCLACGAAVPLEYVRTEGKAKRMKAQMMAIVTEGKGRRNYYAPTPEQEKVATQARPEWEPVGELVGKAAVSVPLYGMTQHRDLFTPRQLTALTTFSDLVAEAREQVEADAIAFGMNDDPTPLRDGGTGARAYAEAVSVYLAFAVDKGASYWSTICSWTITREGIGQTFVRQALPMVWDFAEANPLSESTGNWINNMNWIGKSLETLPLSQISGIIHQVDATKLKQKNYRIISTDPPYYDNIGYADLSDFFYGWMRSAVGNIYPNIFGTMLTPKAPELIASPYRFKGDKNAAKEHFEEGLRQAFTQMRDIAPANYPLTVYYAFKQQEIVLEEGTASTGWETMLSGLIETGFQIVGTWPMHTERNTGVKASSNALASSIVLVCRPRPEDAPLTSRRAFINDLRRELPAALQEMQSGHIAPVDLAQASIGPGMAVYSRHSKVLEADGTPLSVRTALQLINHELDAYLAEQEGDIDSASRFALAWFEQFGFKKGDFGQADVLARAKNTSLERLVKAGVLESGAGQVRLVSWRELDLDWEPKGAEISVWEATHHLIERLHNQGEMGTAKLLAKLAPDLAAEARQLAYRLYSLCERKGWPDQARDYNTLVISWQAAAEEAVSLSPGQYQQGSLIDN